jgi:NADPH-dependent ferric siderophore reductase
MTADVGAARGTRTTAVYRSVRVRQVRQLTPGMARITFGGEDLDGFAVPAPDAYVKVFFPGPGQAAPQLPPPMGEDDAVSWYRSYLAMPDAERPPMRTYTVRAHRAADHEIDIDFVLHGDTGPASAWARRAAPGDEVALLGAHGLYTVPDAADWQLLIGDETALPALGGILEELPEGIPARAFIEVESPREEQSLDTGDDVRVHWVHRAGAPHGQPLLDAVRGADLPGTPPYAWVSGEAGMVKLTRRHLVRERHVDKRAITFTGYWRIGVTEEQTGRESVRRIEAGQAPAEDD